MYLNISNFIIYFLDFFLKYSYISSSYPIYPAHKNLRLGSEEGKKAATHTYKGECV